MEKNHAGEFIAIASTGKVILGGSADEVLREAVDSFGKGNFALTREGEEAFGKWLNFNLSSIRGFLIGNCASRSIGLGQRVVSYQLIRVTPCTLDP